MPTENNTTAGRTASEIEQKLTRGYFVKRGDIMKAFGLSKSDMPALIPSVFVPVPNPRFKHKRFVRSQVMEVARRWERPAA